MDCHPMDLRVYLIPDIAMNRPLSRVLFSPPNHGVAAMRRGTRRRVRFAAIGARMP